MSLSRMSWLLGGLLVVLLAGGCTNPSTGGKTRHRIAVIPKGTTHDFWKAIHAGAEKAAR